MLSKRQRVYISLAGVCCGKNIHRKEYLECGVVFKGKSGKLGRITLFDWDGGRSPLEALPRGHSAVADAKTWIIFCPGRQKGNHCIGVADTKHRPFRLGENKPVDRVRLDAASTRGG